MQQYAHLAPAIDERWAWSVLPRADTGTCGAPARSAVRGESGEVYQDLLDQGLLLIVPY